VPPQRRFATGTMSVLLEGSDVLERAAELTRRLGDLEVVQSEEPPVWWGRYPFRSGDVALRLQTEESGLHLLAYVLADAAGSPVPVRGGVGTGHGWAGLTADMPPQQLINVLEAAREVLLARGGTAVVQCAPPHLRELLAPYRVP
jgi:glycolate oxidase FAD binding subunit